MKTNKHLTLSLVRDKESIRARDIVDQFDYSPDTARSYLSYLAKHDLLERTLRGYVLTEKGSERLQYFDALSCSSFDCPLCLNKKANHFVCPDCGHEIPKKEARILPEKDYLFVTRHREFSVLYAMNWYLMKIKHSYSEFKRRNNNENWMGNKASRMGCTDCACWNNNLFWIFSQ